MYGSFGSLKHIDRGTRGSDPRNLRSRDLGEWSVITRFFASETLGASPYAVCSVLQTVARSTGLGGRTRWVGDNSIKEPATSPGVACDVERAEIYDPLRNPVLSSRAEDTWGFTFGTTSVRAVASAMDKAQDATFSTHLPTINVRPVHVCSKICCRLVTMSRHARCLCSHASSSTHVGHASSSDEGVIHEFPW